MPLLGALIVAVVMLAPCAARAGLCDFQACSSGDDCSLFGNTGLCENGTCVDLSCGEDTSGSTCGVDTNCSSHSCDTSIPGGQCRADGLVGVAEIQLSVASLGVQDLVTGFIAGVKDANVCQATTTTFPCISDPTKSCILSGVTFNGQVTLRHGMPGTVIRGGVTGAIPELLIPVQIFEQENCVQDPTCAPPDSVTGGPLFVVEQLSAETDRATGDVLLCNQFEGVSGTTLGLALPLPSALQARLPAALLKKNCQDLSVILGGALSAIGLSVADIQVATDTPGTAPFSQAATRLAIRMSPADPEWQAGSPPVPGPPQTFTDTFATFFDNQLAPAPASSDWSVYVGFSALAANVEARIIANAMPTLQQIDPNAFVTPNGRSWTSIPAQVGLGLTAKGDGHFSNGSVGATCTFELDLPCTVGMQVKGNNLVLSASCQPSGHVADFAPGDDGVCNFIPDAAVTSIVNDQIASALQGTQLFGDAPCTATPGAVSVTCNLPTNLATFQPFAGGPTLNLSLNHVSGSPQGFVLGGKVSSSGPVSQGLVGVPSGPFQWGVEPTAPDDVPGLPDPCDPDWWNERKGWWAWVDVDGVGDICAVFPVNNGANFWSILGVWTTLPVTPPQVQLGLPGPLQAHILIGTRGDDADPGAAPADFQMQVITTVGSTLVTVPKPPKQPILSPAQALKQAIADIAWRANTCNLEPAMPVGWFNPRWIPDPPSDAGATLVPNVGAAVGATVRLVGYELIWQGGAGAVNENGHVNLAGQSLLLRAEALVEAAPFQPFIVPFSTTLSLDLQGHVDSVAHPLAFAELRVVNAVSQGISVDVPPGLLDGHTDPTLSFTLAIPKHTATQGLTLEGEMPIVVVKGAKGCDDDEDDADRGGDDHGR